MARVNIDLLGIGELKWTGMDGFTSDDHYISAPRREVSPHSRSSSAPLLLQISLGVCNHHHSVCMCLQEFWEPLCSTCHKWYWFSSQRWREDGGLSFLGDPLGQCLGLWSWFPRYRARWTPSDKLQLCVNKCWCCSAWIPWCHERWDLKKNINKLRPFFEICLDEI